MIPQTFDDITKENFQYADHLFFNKFYDSLEKNGFKFDGSPLKVAEWKSGVFTSIEKIEEQKQFAIRALQYFENIEDFEKCKQIQQSI